MISPTLPHGGDRCTVLFYEDAISHALESILEPEPAFPEVRVKLEISHVGTSGVRLRPESSYDWGSHRGHYISDYRVAVFENRDETHGLGRIHLYKLDKQFDTEELLPSPASLVVLYSAVCRLVDEI